MVHVGHNTPFQILQVTPSGRKRKRDDGSETRNWAVSDQLAAGRKYSLAFSA